MNPKLSLKLAPPLARCVISLFRAGVRVRHVHRERIDALNLAGTSYVLTFWHGKLFLMVFAGFSRPITAMVSQHRDGEIFTRVMERFGVSVARGSTTRGGTAALRSMVRLGNEGGNLAITPDGPKGPRHVAQPGVVVAAQLSGKPVMPVTIVYEKKNCCGHGTGLRSRGCSLGRSFSTESQSQFPATSRRMRVSSGELPSRNVSTVWKPKEMLTSTDSGRRELPESWLDRSQPDLTPEVWGLDACAA